MEKIFEKPIMFDDDKGDVVLFYSKYIIGDITKENANLSIERIDKNVFNSSEFESIIDVNEIFEYEFEPDNDSCIMFGIKNNDGKNYKNIDFKDTETAKQVEIFFKDQFKQLGFKREEKQLTALSAATFPLTITTIIAVIGGLLTWFAYSIESYEPQRNIKVKWFVYIFYKVSKAVGYVPFLVLTIILTLLCLFWLVKRMANPPVKISAVK